MNIVQHICTSGRISVAQSDWLVWQLSHLDFTLRETINTGPRTRGPGTQRPKDMRTGDPGIGTRGVAFIIYEGNATCVNVLSSNIWLCCCES